MQELMKIEVQLHYMNVLRILNEYISGSDASANNDPQNSRAQDSMSDNSESEEIKKNFRNDLDEIDD